MKCVQEVIKDLPPFKAKDELGFVYEFFQSLIGTSSFSLLCTWLASIGVSGSFPPSFASFFSGANLLALSKEGGGIRPIAISLCIRRIISASLLRALPSDSLSSFFLPHQFGVAVKNGVETVSWSVRVYADQALENDCIYQNDAKNAFNTIGRDPIRELLSLYFPQFLPFFDLCYSRFGQLRIWREDLREWHWIDSCTGVQQGDPLGPFLFCLALQPVLRELCIRFPGWSILASWMT